MEGKEHYQLALVLNFKKFQYNMTKIVTPWYKNLIKIGLKTRHKE
jgi:hypothetical protein